MKNNKSKIDLKKIYNNIENDYTGLNELLQNKIQQFLIIDKYYDQVNENQSYDENVLFCKKTRTLFTKIQDIYIKNIINQDILFFVKNETAIYMFELYKNRYTKVLSINYDQQMNNIVQKLFEYKKLIDLSISQNQFYQIIKYDLSKNNNINHFNIINTSMDNIELNLDNIKYLFLTIQTKKEIKFISHKYKIFFLESDNSIQFLNEEDYYLKYIIEQYDSYYLIQLNKYFLSDASNL